MIKENSSQWRIWEFTRCNVNDFPELPLDGPWLVPGVSAAHLSTPDTLLMSLCAGRLFHPGSAAVTMCSRCCSEPITRSWVTPDSAQALANSRKPCRPSYTTCDPKVISSWTDVWAVIRGSDNVSVLSLLASSGFMGSPAEVSLPCPCLDSSLCLCVHLHLSGYPAPHLLVVIPSVALLWLHPNSLMLRGDTQCL